MGTEMNTEVNTEYGADQIQILEGLEAVRKRPGMYIGSTSSRGLHHLVYEIVDNAVDEALAGYCDTIRIFVNEDNSITVLTMAVAFLWESTTKQVFLLLKWYLPFFMQEESLVEEDTRYLVVFTELGYLLLMRYLSG